MRTRRGRARAGGQRRRAAGRRPRALCARPGVGPACLAPRAPSSSRGIHGLLARLPHPPRRSSASPLPRLFLLLLRERGRCLRAGIAVAGAWGGGGARAALCFCRGRWVGGARGRGLGLGPGEEAACGGRIQGFVPAGSCTGTCGAEIGATCLQIPFPQCPALYPAVPRPRPLPAFCDWNLEMLDFCVTINVLSLCNSCVNLVKLYRRYCVLLKGPFQLLTSVATILAARGRNAQRDTGSQGIKTFFLHPE